jgi:hypothetical protein
MNRKMVFFSKFVRLFGIITLLAISLIQPLTGVAAPQQGSGTQQVLEAVNSPQQKPRSGLGTFVPDVWLDPDGQPLPFTAVQEVEEFLRTARIESAKPVGKGINNPLKVLLEQDGIRMYAIFRDVHVERDQMPLSNGRTSFYFRDEALFETAAYELSKLLGLHNVPPTVKRTVRRVKGTLQVWVSNARTLRDFEKQEISPPNKWRWMMQWQRIHLFDNLIYNEDRNQGNALVDPNWKLWMIDHTRAFRRWKQLPDPKLMRFCEQDLWERLQKLDEATLEQRLKDFLSPVEIKGLIERKKLLLEYLQGLIDVKGEGEILFALP